MDIKLLEENDRATYNLFVENHPDGTIYHTSEWTQVHVQSLGFTSYCILAVENNRLQGAIPFLSSRNVFGRKLVSVPIGHLCKPLYGCEKDLTQMLDYSVRLAEELHCKGATIKAGDRLPVPGFYERDEQFVLSELPLSSVTELWKNVKDPVKRAIKKAKKSGIKIYDGQNSEDWRAFYEVYCETKRFQGIPAYPFRFFQTVQDMFSPTNRVRLILAGFEGKVLAGVILLYYKDRVYYSFGASTKNQAVLQMRPNQALFWEVIKEASENGYKVFDFGFSHKSNIGLIRFKSQWGARERPHYDYHYIRSRQGRNAVNREGRGFRIFASLMRKIPIAVHRHLDPLLIKLFV
ncbi:MAG: GNAT family N-acetyltransferase [Patescibacteria group bacterium]|nr:GNAT family N-acetyltransferase [Patescibacteria group bacterium]